MESQAPQCDLNWDSDDSEPPSLELGQFVQALCRALDLSACELSVLVVDDDRMRTLNQRYRGLDKTTDVLSFPQAPVANGVHRHLGDIVISWPRVKAQAESIGHGVGSECRFLILHGVLHLLGYDHESDQGEMLRLQGDLKRRLFGFFEEEPG